MVFGVGVFVAGVLALEFFRAGRAIFLSLVVGVGGFTLAGCFVVVSSRRLRNFSLSEAVGAWGKYISICVYTYIVESGLGVFSFGVLGRKSRGKRL